MRWSITRGRSGPQAAKPGSAYRAARAAGAKARICPGSRCERSESWRSPTTTSRATGSATARRSSAGARTSRRPTAATTRWNPAPRTCSVRSSGPDRPDRAQGGRCPVRRAAAGTTARTPPGSCTGRTMSCSLGGGRPEPWRGPAGPRGRRHDRVAGPCDRVTGPCAAAWIGQAPSATNPMARAPCARPR